MANVSASRSLRDSGASWSMSGWRWNPYFGMFTFIPYRGYLMSPFGYAFYSPREIYRIYEQPYAYRGGGWDASRSAGGGTGSAGGSRSASVPSYSPPASAPSSSVNTAAPSAPAASRSVDAPRSSGGRSR
jgi:hypothetical protein